MRWAGNILKVIGGTARILQEDVFTALLGFQRPWNSRLCGVDLLPYGAALSGVLRNEERRGRPIDRVCGDTPSPQ